jgi:hypothetical protein
MGIETYLKEDVNVCYLSGRIPDGAAVSNNPINLGIFETPEAVRGFGVDLDDLLEQERTA